MNYMFSDILRLDPLQRSLIVAVIYMIPLQKRENYRMRMGISILACLFAAPLIRIYTRWSVQIFRTISGNPRQFNYRDESAGLCVSAQKI